MSAPAFVISLDFELYWGLRDCVSLDAYRQNLLGVRQAVPAMLDLFRQRGIRVTWATVGFLFCRTKQEIEESVPARLPQYRDPTLSPYDLSGIGADEVSDPFHYAPSLVRAIASTPGQEVATHTFSHFYCLEEGQTALEFDADLKSARRAAERLDVEVKSLVFPRNQENEAYRHVLAENGIRAFRPAAAGWAYRPGVAREPQLKRMTRLLDSYVPVTGHRTFSMPVADGAGLVPIPASTFLRPFSPRLARLDPLLLHRIACSMEAAARSGDVFHLWWHPHNFGIHLRENLDRLVRLLDHFASLSRRYRMESLSMGDLAARVQ